jgi:hypothetical protein
LLEAHVVASLAISEQEFPHVATTVLVALMGVVAVIVIATRRRTVVAEVKQNARLAGLPADPASHDEAVRRQLRRFDGRTYGLFGALAIGAPALLLSEGGTASFAWTLAFYAWIAFGWFGTVVGSSVAHLRELHRRRRTVATRAAQLRRRRLTDYLSPLELVALSVPGLLAVWPAALALITLGKVDAGRSSVLFISSVLELLFLLMIALLLCATLALPSLAASETGLRWEEAERARSLRDLAEMTTRLTMGLAVALPNLVLADEPAAYPTSWAFCVIFLPPLAGPGGEAGLLCTAS